MAEDRYSKTEQPTQHRLEEARKEGFIPYSSDLSALSVLVGGIVVLAFWGPALVGNLIALIRQQLTEGAHFALIPENVGFLVKMWTERFLLLIAPLIVAILALSFIANITQTQGLFAPKVLSLKWDRLDMVKNVRQKFSLRGWVELLKSGVKVVLVGSLAFLVLKSQLPHIIALSAGELGLWAKGVWGVALKLSLWLLVAFAVIAIGDFIFQHYRYRHDLKMSRQELKDEFRQTEGDPHIRSKIRSLQLKMSLNRMIKNLPRADVVVTNPTHIAVALEYDAERMSAPTVIAKGKGKLAERIKAIAEEHDIPVVEDPELARALYKMCEVGFEIPYQLYQAVAQVLAWVYQLKAHDHPLPGGEVYSSSSIT